MSSLPSGSFQPVPAPNSLRGTPPTGADLRKKAFARLAERIDPAKIKHKPLSLVRQDAKRVLEQFFDTEQNTIPRMEREKLIEEIIGDAIGFGPLEELFRDESVLEILVLAPTQVIVRKAEGWLPTSARYRDNEHIRTSTLRALESSEPFVTSSQPQGAFDVRLQNGFRLIVILPPTIMEQSLTALYCRLGVSMPQPAGVSGIIRNPAPGAAHLSDSAGFSAGPKTEMIPRGGSMASNAGISASGPKTELIPRGGFSQSGPLSELLPRRPTAPTTGAGPASGSGTSPRPMDRAAPLFPGSKVNSGFITTQSMTRSVPAAPPTTPPAAAAPEPAFDPLLKDRQRITQRIISKFASAGMYDLNAIPGAELRRIVLAHVVDYCAAEKLGIDDQAMERLASEILAGINR